jgi:hypothetical protein
MPPLPSSCPICFRLNRKCSSKLGDWEDIEHNTLASIEGEFYGAVAAVLKRKIPNAKASTK